MKFISAILFLLSLKSSGQIAQLLNQNKIEYYYILEDSLKSIVHLNNVIFGVCDKPWKDPNCKSGKNLNGRIFKRTNDNFLTGNYVWYFTYPNNNARYIMLNWGFYNNSAEFKEVEIKEKVLGKEMEFKHKYDSLKVELIKYLGKPSGLEQINEGVYYCSKMVKWNFRDKYIVLKFHFNKTEFKKIEDCFKVDGRVNVDIYFKKEN